MKRLAREAGFDLVKVSSAEPLSAERSRFLTWVESGRSGEMRWLTREWALTASEPEQSLPFARSVICVGMSYWSGPRRQAAGNTGKIARYAWGADYHKVLGTALQRLAESLAGHHGGQHRWYVDTGPIMDKALAARSGLGWYGKNTNILTKRFGSFVLLGEVLTTLELEPDTPLQRDCGECRLCVVACPTQALGPDYTIDSRRCISYLTIEHRGPIPRDLRSAMGAWVFGCDICQDVCPPTMKLYMRSPHETSEWARQVRAVMRRDSDDVVTAKDGPAVATTPLFPAEARQSVDLIWLLRLNPSDYLAAFRGTSIRRAKAWMLRRNAAIALGNMGQPSCVDPLFETLRSDEHPIVRGHCAWALGRLATRLHTADVRDRLVAALHREPDSEVRAEIRWSIDSIQ